MKISSEWFPFGLIDESKKIIFGFHCAGGSASSYREWTQNTLMDFVPIELPGRGKRIREKCVENIEVLTDALVVPILEATKEREYSFYGHSMGALIAFKVAYKLQQLGKGPQKLIVAGYPAPISTSSVKKISCLNDIALIEILRKLGGTPEEILIDEEMMDFILPIVRSDYRLLESFRYKDEILDIPIIVHIGNEDQSMNMENASLWKNVTNKSCIVKRFRGSHFFIYESGELYLKKLADDFDAI